MDVKANEMYGLQSDIIVYGSVIVVANIAGLAGYGIANILLAVI
jgi:hypothetical protein